MRFWAWDVGKKELGAWQEEEEEEDGLGDGNEESCVTGPFSTPVRVAAEEREEEEEEEEEEVDGRSQTKTRPPLSWFRVELPVS